MSEYEKQVRKFPRHIRAYLRKKKHQNIFKDEYKAIADAIKAKIKEKEELQKQMEFNF